MEQMRIKHNETGRSMVEMLGVLAVVGVLSIGGVAGYRYAVDKMNANEIINEVKKRAVTASQQQVSGQDTINLKEYYPNAEFDMIRNMYEVAVEPSYQNNEGFFALEVYDIPKGICRQILRSDWSLPVATELNEIVINDGTECNEGDDNKILFAFSNTLGSGDANGGGGVGRPPVDPNNECTKSDETPLRDQQGNCHSCNELDIINIKDSGDCSVCDGSRGAKRYVASVMGLRGKACVLASDCPEGSIPNDQTGYCDCPEGQIMTWWGNKCLPCDKAVETEENGLLSVLEDNAVSVCAVCGWEATKEGMTGDPNGTRQCIIPESSVPSEVSGVVTVTETESTVTETVSPEVSGGGQICDIEDGNCYSCDDTDRYSIIVGNGSYSDACNACNNTEYKWTLKYESSSGSRIDRSVCVRCDEEILSAYEDDVVATCSACNRGVDWTSLDTGYGERNVYYCSSGSDSITATVAQTQIQTQTDTSTISNPEVSVSVSEEGYFDTDRGDFSCSELAALPPGTRIMVASSTANLSSCPILKTNNIATTYAYIPCPSDAPINNHGTCHSCGESDELSDLEDRCSECPNRFKTNIDTHPGEAYTCTLCSFPSSRSDTTPTECARCNGENGGARRYYSNGSCTLCPDNLNTLSSSDTCEQCGGTWNNGKCSP